MTLKNLKPKVMMLGDLVEMIMLEPGDQQAMTRLELGVQIQ